MCPRRWSLPAAGSVFPRSLLPALTLLPMLLLWADPQRMCPTSPGEWSRVGKGKVAGRCAQDRMGVMQGWLCPCPEFQWGSAACGVDVTLMDLSQRWQGGDVAVHCSFGSCCLSAQPRMQPLHAARARGRPAFRTSRARARGRTQTSALARRVIHAMRGCREDGNIWGEDGASPRSLENEEDDVEQMLGIQQSLWKGWARAACVRAHVRHGSAASPAALPGEKRLV